MADSHARGVAKADTFAIPWLITGTAALAGGVAATEAVTEAALFHLHERAWNPVRRGRGRGRADAPRRSAVEAVGRRPSAPSTPPSSPGPSPAAPRRRAASRRPGCPPRPRCSAFTSGAGTRSAGRGRRSGSRRRTPGLGFQAGDSAGVRGACSGFLGLGGPLLLEPVQPLVRRGRPPLGFRHLPFHLSGPHLGRFQRCCRIRAASAALVALEAAAAMLRRAVATNEPLDPWAIMVALGMRLPLDGPVY